MAISFAQVRVLDPSRIARRLLWHVLSIGVVSRDEPESHAGLDKAGLFLFRVKAGRGTLELSDEAFPLQRRASWWLLDLARSRRYVPAGGTPLVTMGVRFSGPAIDTWRQEAFRSHGAFVLSTAAPMTRLNRSVEELKRLAAAPTGQAEWRIHELVTDVLGVFLKTQDLLNSRAPVSHSPSRRVMDVVQANPLRNWQAAELAAIAQTGYSSLRKHFKATQGETLHEFLQRTRLEKARERLSDVRLTVKEIASQLDFSSEFYFSRWFHAAAGMSPSRFRTMLRG